MTAGTRKVLFFIILIAIAWLAYSFMIKPANAQLADQRDALNKKLTKLNELELATAAARDLTKQIAQLEEAIQFFESKLPPQSEIHKVLEQVTLIAQKKGLRPKTIRTLKPKDCNGYIEQPLNMELHGHFNSYYSFLLELERLPRITKIRELELKKSSRNESETEAKFIVSIFFQNSVG